MFNTVLIYKCSEVIDDSSYNGILYDDVFHPPPLRLESRKPLWRDLQTIDITSRWMEDWQSATLVNSTLVVDPTIQLPGFDLHRRQWSLLNRFRTDQGHCNACHKKWGFTDNEQ